MGKLQTFEERWVTIPPIPILWGQTRVKISIVTEHPHFGF